MRQPTVTIKDVARAAGVNISTVSRALNDGYGIHEDTRNHIRQVADRLNYRPNRFARGLVTGRSHTLGLIVSDIRNPFFAEVARGAEDAARAGGCDLVLCNSDLDSAKQLGYVRSLAEKRVDGLLMNSVAALTASEQEQLAAARVPVVLLNRSSSKAFSTVCADNDSGGVLAAQHLLRLGHRKIAHLTGPRHNGNMAERAQAFQRTLKRANADVKLTVIHGENSFPGGHDMTQRLLRDHPEVTAVFAANDVIAFGALRAIHDLGRRVPDDISLVGFDDLELSSVVYPPLTTIHQPKYELGKTAVELLLRLAAARDKAVPEHVVMGVRLVERQSAKEKR